MAAVLIILKDEHALLSIFGFLVEIGKQLLSLGADHGAERVRFTADHVLVDGVGLLGFVDALDA